MLVASDQTDVEEELNKTVLVDTGDGVTTDLDHHPFVSQDHKLQLTVSPTFAAARGPTKVGTTLATASSLLKSRFAQALRKNNRSALRQCLESGYMPTVSQWMNIIVKMHVRTALSCVTVAKMMEPACIAAAIRRQHRVLFKEVANRVDIIPKAQMESLMSVPAYYLQVCLRKGLDPNIILKNHRLPLEHACAHSRIAHIEILLSDPRTTVSPTVCRFVIRQQQQQHFAERAIELCGSIVPNMILEAIVANVTTALCSIMAKLEQNYENNPKWDEITHMLRCPISQDYSTDLVKTPVNNHYYDRMQLLTWVRAKGTDPMTRAELQESDLLLRNEFLSEYAVTLQQKIKELDC